MILAVLKQRIEDAKRARDLASRSAAALVVRKFRSDATTKRGNVPSFGRMGDVPIAAVSRPEAIVVTGPAWCVRKAEALKQTAKWRKILASEVNSAMRGTR